MKYDKEYFKKQLKGAHFQAKAIVGVRAALRVLPLLSFRSDSDAEGFAYWGWKSNRQRHIFSLFHNFAIAEFINSLPKLDRAAMVAFTASRAAVTSAVEAAGTVPLTAVRTAFRSALESTNAAAFAANLDDKVTDRAIEAITFARDATAMASARTSFTAENSSAASAISYAAANATRAAFELTCDGDINALRQRKHWLAGIFRQRSWKGVEELAPLLPPLWPDGMPPEFEKLWGVFEKDVLELGAGFEVWLDWYRDRISGVTPRWEIEREWALLTKRRLAQEPAEINDYLQSLRDGSLIKQLKRVRAIFIGHGEVGKTSLIKALHGEDVIPGSELMTKGIDIKDRKLNEKIEEEAGVFTRETEYTDDDLTVHFWDFGGQVMAHATHQFFLRANCLYIIVLAGRAQHNPNEEAEYWLEHVRAFGDHAPTLLVGNKSDIYPVNLDLRTLKQKYQNIIDFFPISCTQAKGRFKVNFDYFKSKFTETLVELGESAERFTPTQFQVLREVQHEASNGDFLSEDTFNNMCLYNGISMEGPGGRNGLLDIFDKLGIVMYFSKLPYLTDFIINPLWLTYGVYTIMYSEEAQAAKGRISEFDIVSILGKASLAQGAARELRYPRDRCRIIADAMIAFQVAYRLGVDRLVIPALLVPEQPKHDFDLRDALAFQFDFKGFLPRHVLPALVVEHNLDITKNSQGEEVVWQNGVLLRPRRLGAEALVKADYHARTMDIFVRGADANEYLGIIRDGIQRTLATMPELPFEEKVQLRPEMRAGGNVLSGDPPIWMSYGSINGARKRGRVSIDGPDGYEYDMNRILAVIPANPESVPAEVFISYSHKDGALTKALVDKLDSKRITAWFDRGLIAGQPYRDVLKKRIETTKAVLVIWTKNSINSDWVIAEADLASQHGKLICLLDQELTVSDIPLPFAANYKIASLKDTADILAAINLKIGEKSSLKTSE